MPELNLGLLLFIPYRAMETAVMDALAEQGYPITLAQARVFQRINPEGSRLGELAQAAQLSKQAVTHLVEQLVLAGYVERAADPSDARARLVTITDRGKEMVRISAETVERTQAAWEDHLGASAIRQLRRTLTKLREITDPWA
ncbi:MAG: MarR family transcriptional regulator [Actinomycetota bacterium]|nr:MarR family transcriptional regulator [Actinomycetota bacterium]